MTRDLSVMDSIIREKEIEIDEGTLQPLDEEGKTLAEQKRFTFDVINVPNDPLR